MHKSLSTMGSPTEIISRRNALAGLGALAGAAGLGSIHQALAAEGGVLSEFKQIGFVFEDIDKAIEQFSDLLGQEAPQAFVTGTFEKANTHFRGEPTEAQAKLAFFRFGEGRFSLIEPIGGPSSWQEHLQKHGESVHHVAFQTNGLSQVLKTLQKRGFPTIQTGEFSGGRYAYVDTTAAFTVQTELFELD